jgi:glycosyltransferase involved in cell wall biosynthesis
MSGPFHILFLHPSYTFGGAERTALNLLKNLDRTTFKVTLITSNKIASYFSEVPLEKSVSLDEIGIDVWFRDVTISNLRKFLSDVKVIAQVLKKEMPDIAFGMMYYASSLLSMAKILFRLKTRIISSPRGPLNPYINTFYAHKKIDRLFWKLNFFFSCYFSDGLAVASEGTQRECINIYRAKRTHIKVIHNGINAGYVRARALEAVDLSIPSDSFIISTAGRLAYEKNLPLLLKTLSILKKTENAKLIVIGDGPDRQELERLSHRLGIKEDVYFLGFQKNPFKFIRRSDLFVHTCLLEGFGNIIVEAMACGVPVIATDCPYGPREIIRNGENGILVPVDDDKALSEAILSMLHSESLRKQLSQKGYERSLDFSVERMVKAYEDLFLQISAVKKHNS